MTPLPSPAAPPHASRSRQRGFTLIELLIAMAAGLSVSAAAILLAKNATRFFQHEARASAANLAALLGLSRISSDLQRAGFHSSPNVQKERANNGICGDPTNWPDGMRRLAGVNIQRQGSVFNHIGQLNQSLANEFTPDSIIIGGSLNTVEEFRFNSIECGGGGCVVNLQYDSSAMNRTRERTGAGAEDLAAIFKARRLLRLRFDGQTKSMYGVIRTLDPLMVPGQPIRVLLEAVPNLPTMLGEADCGVKGFSGGGGYANPISRVRYDIRSLLNHPKYGPLVAPINPAVTGDNERTELVRVELDEQNNEMPETLELVAEYAVDLKFGISVATESGVPGTRNPQITRYPIVVPDSSDIYNTAGDITDLGNSGTMPERIRSVQVRLTTRTRAPDRGADVGRREDGRKLRFVIPGILPSVNSDMDTVPPGAPDLYARLRTLYTDVALSNQAGVEW